MFAASVDMHEQISDKPKTVVLNMLLHAAMSCMLVLCSIPCDTAEAASCYKRKIW